MTARRSMERRVESRAGYRHSLTIISNISKARIGQPSYVRTPKHRKLMADAVREAKRRIREEIL
jgi:hypothetical protein